MESGKGVAAVEGRETDGRTYVLSSYMSVSDGWKAIWNNDKGEDRKTDNDNLKPQKTSLYKKKMNRTVQNAFNSAN